jgi:O-antigen ligase
VDSSILKVGAFLVVVFGSCSLVLLAHARPGYFSNEAYLSAFIFLQLLLAAVWKFRRWFYVLLVLSFIFAGTDLPMGAGWTTARWIVLAVGAVVGFVAFMRDRRYHFGAFHLLSMFCVLTSVASAIVSYYPSVAFLKAASLLLLFLYSSSGGRLALLGRPRDFFSGLLVGCEITTAITAITYFALHQETWGNPNSLGLVMGVVIVPLLLWGVLISESRPLRSRRTVFLVIALALLMFSNSRSAILACVISATTLCVALRQRKIMIQGTAAVLLLVGVFAILAPGRLVEFTSSSTDTLLYKGKRQAGLLGSRNSPWQQTMNVIQQHPWFGSGFGTSPSGTENMRVQVTSSTTETAREHGSSYLAILEWVGLLGVMPFYGLILFLLITVARVFVWMRRTADPFHPAVPLAVLILAGLVHAAFEDWLFAVGYYLCVFYWPLAFALMDFAPSREATGMDIVPTWPSRHAGAPSMGVLARVR